MTALSVPRRKKKARRQKPPPLNAHLITDPIRWSRVRVMTFVWQAIAVYVFTCIAAALYWLLLETNVPAHDAWHNLVPNPTERHLGRAALEAILAGYGVKMVVHNHYKAKTTMSTFRRFVVKRLRVPMAGDDETLTVPQALWATFVWLVLVSVASVLAVLFITKGLGVSLSHESGAMLPSNPTFGDKVWFSIQNVVADWPLKLIVFSASLAGGWVIKGIADDVQVFSVQRRLRHHHPLRWGAQKLYPPPYIGRYNDVSTQPRSEDVEFAESNTVAIKILVALGVALFVLGWLAIGLYLPHV